jgi:hypothetical protein
VVVLKVPVGYSLALSMTFRRLTIRESAPSSPTWGPQGQGVRGQHNGEDGRWPPNRTLRIVWKEVRGCSVGPKIPLTPPGCGAPSPTIPSMSGCTAECASPQTAGLEGTDAADKY